MRLIPAIDLRGGRCVRLYQGDFARETRYESSAQDLAVRYRRLGADWLHVVDLDAARGGANDGTSVHERRSAPHGGGTGTPGVRAADGADGATRHVDGTGAASDAANRAVIAALSAEGGLRLQVGGGLRDEAAVAEMFDLGASRVVVGSAALSRSHEVRAWIERFGPDRVVLAFDVRLDESRTPRVTTHGWQHQSSVSLWDAVTGFSPRLRHVLCTDVSRDGALSGPNLELYREATRRFPDVLWQASGGIRNALDLAALADSGAAAAISGKALLENLMPAEELKPFLPSA
jgi:phosphoribosylformimino-5-aminoimidazole carboxamide ribotide isomerase